MKTYNPELLDKNYIIAISKCDLLDDELQKEMEAAESSFAASLCIESQIQPHKRDEYLV